MIALLAPLACSSNQTTSGDAGAVGPTVSWTDACNSYATAWCAQLAACQADVDVWTSATDCESAAAAVCVSTFSATALNAAGYKACLDAWNAFGPQCMGPTAVQVCQVVAQGSVPVGGACAVQPVAVGNGWDSLPIPIVACAHGWCGNTGSGSSDGGVQCGACQAAKPPGSTCAIDSECDPTAGYHCSSSSGAGPTTCVKYAAAGEPCAHQTDCDPRVPVLYCDGVTQKCKQLPQTVGAACDDLCGGDLYCPPTGTCAGPLDEGATCTLPGTTPLAYRYNLQCNLSKGLACIGMGSTGTCTRVNGAVGAACGSSTPVWKESCWHSYCSVYGSTDGGTGTCVPLTPQQGAACPTPALPSCAPPYYCVDGTCKAPVVHDTCP